MTEISESFVEVEEENLKVRVEYIRSKLLESSVMLRGNIPEGLSDQDLTENNVFKQLYIFFEKVKQSCFVCLLFNVECLLFQNMCALFP